ncbi:hypothetical protein [Spirillospora sp. NPDC047279]|uniref:hypothetical protein n=1 Tax=Spirillospora sp. NPDC047279 TaxID=3155478 RepID=UPI0033EAD5A5
MNPRLDAVEWGKKQASNSPTWSEEKWIRVSVILQVIFTSAEPGRTAEPDQDQPSETMRDAA